MHGELLVERLRLVLKNADRHRLAQHDRRIAVAAPVDARQNAVAEGYVVCEFIQLTVYSELARICAAIGRERKAIAGGDQP